MTENEAIIEVRKLRSRGSIIPQKRAEMMDVAIQALEEIQQYRETGLTPQMVKDLTKSEKEAHKAALENAHVVDEYREIGTVEKLRALKEKNKPKKPVDKIMYLECPNFGDVGILDCGYCSACGQAIDWSK
jgi:hypothetical protein